ncbi:DUF2935 domain-containing protein [Desulfosporosinus nitroreducens]|uniref:DUF2935 domain-containing protein n=1 Tax=Desulfosporosinus nitroreducens TaxID=2018668 RepID=A0ABT8QQE9_9FIRM|nr:DUF2935 domain-containing protein [Desulfosporosinus nitroreducens]MCO1604059.1 DUF2935 domain-containing protein [Desulfosporosinus nitroreducens]MDO0823572.1 DUF2935 domain-containing protein [Desulfosporosinus nitroreducens]
MGHRISVADFVRLSLEANLFFLRIMKEHSFFLEAGFLPKDLNLASQADQFKEQFNALLQETVGLANRNISRIVLSSGEVVTDKTLRAEQKTIELSGILIDTELTLEELELEPGVPNPNLANAVANLNQRAIALTQELIQFKTRILNQMLDCTLFTFNFPLLIDHIRREAIFFVQQLERLQRREQVNPTQEIISEKAFWDRIMKEHAQFISHLLDPTEVALIDTADTFADLFALLQGKVQRAEENIIARLLLGSLIREETRATRDIRDFKATATEGLLACQIRSIIIPLLGDHVLREANHFLRILTNPRSLI